MSYKPTILELAAGGTNASLTASNGGILYSTASAGAILAGTATAGQILRSGASTTPAWSTATYPATAGTSGNVLTSDGTNFTSSTPATKIGTINGDSGSISGATVTIYSNNASQVCGSSVQFVNSSTTSTLNVTDASNNTIIGNGAGNASISGNSNTGLGYRSLLQLSSGTNNVSIGLDSMLRAAGSTSNTAVGYQSLCTLTTGADSNVGIGLNTGYGGSGGVGLLTGTFNVLVGTAAGQLYTGAESSNILLNANGVAGESHVFRVGDATGTGVHDLQAAYINGISGVTVTGTAVLCATDGQLGTIASSIRYKENVKDISENVSIMKLRPVEFNYKKDVSKKTHYGLIAEEVEKEFPYLCFYNEKGVPESVIYHEIPTLLLKEIQRLTKRIEILEKNGLQK